LRFVAQSRDRLLSGRYRLVEEIGRGGMGTVWWAHDEVENREVAVKEVHLPPSLDHREQMNLVRRTNREAMAAGRLRHPGLISMYDVVIEDSRPWLIMEYVPARSLEDVFLDDGPISPLRVAEVGRQLLAALCAAHDAGIVHRDVKPSNVLLTPSGRVVLTDFGIATYEGATTLTQSGTFMGSPAYVAPEVARGERATPVSDLWSLGATLYAAVEGRPPYDHETAMATLSALVTTEPDPPVRAGPLRPLLEGLLTKDPARRLTAGRAGELLAAVTAPPPRKPDRSRVRRFAVLPAVTTSTSPTRPPKPNRSRVQRFAVVPAVTGGVLALAVAAGVVAGVKGWTAPHSGKPSAVPSTAPGTASPSVAARPPAGPLPATIVGRSGGPVARRLAKGGGTWPATPALTLTIPDRGRRPGPAEQGGAGRRVSVIVTCPTGARSLSFSAYALGHSRRPVSGTCVASGRRGALTTTFRLPAGTSPGQVRVRVRPGPASPGGSVQWLAGVYEGVGR
jgi:hypothetical protein